MWVVLLVSTGQTPNGFALSLRSEWWDMEPNRAWTGHTKNLCLNFGEQSVVVYRPGDFVHLCKLVPRDVPVPGEVPSVSTVPVHFPGVQDLSPNPPQIVEDFVSEGWTLVPGESPTPLH